VAGMLADLIGQFTLATSVLTDILQMSPGSGRFCSILEFRSSLCRRQIT
jgi:hypothetical protein